MDTKAIKEGLARRFAQCQALWEGFKKDSAPRAAAFARGLALRFRPGPKVTNEELLSRLAGLTVKIDALSQKVDAVEAKQAALVKTAQDLPPLAVSAILAKVATVSRLTKKIERILRHLTAMHSIWVYPNAPQSARGLYSSILSGQPAKCPVVQRQNINEALNDVTPEDKNLALLYQLKRIKKNLKKLRLMGYSDAQIAKSVTDNCGTLCTPKMIAKVIGKSQDEKQSA